MAKTVGLTDAELQAVKSMWALVMSTNVAKTAGGLLLAYVHDIAFVTPQSVCVTSASRL